MSKFDAQRNKLLDLRKQLQSVVATGEASAAVVELDQSKVGRLSRMDAMQAQAMSQASAERRQQVLKKIESAIRRIDDDEFGMCLHCEEPIHPERLNFDPTSTLCIDCARGAEA